MVMPFLRLLAIYAVVIIGITAFFQRDRIMDLAGFAPPEAVEIDTDVGADVKTEGMVVAGTGTDATAAFAPAVTEVSENTEPSPTEPEVNETHAQIATPLVQEPVNAEPAAVTSATAQPAPVARPAKAADVAAGMDNARKAYWQGDMRGAEAHYRTVLLAQPQNADANIELGNMLYGQRRYDDAAIHYFAAGKILVANGNPDQALPLFQILQGIAPDRAAALRTLATQ